MNIILIILVFGVIVFFHEFGHFIVAKMNKIAAINNVPPGFCMEAKSKSTKSGPRA